jgi:hypothetical protein
VLTSLAARFGVSEPVQLQKVCVDPKMQWSRVGNVWRNAGALAALRDGGGSAALGAWPNRSLSNESHAYGAFCVEAYHKGQRRYPNRRRSTPSW